MKQQIEVTRNGAPAWVQCVHWHGTVVEAITYTTNPERASRYDETDVPAILGFINEQECQ